MKPRWPRFLVAGALMVIGMLFLSGCASSMMQPAASQAAPEASRALVTFLRPSYFGGAIQFGIWDSDQFVGILEPGSYIQILVPPGEHIFLARAENWSYVHANLEAGRQYFILAKVFPGIWKARVAYDPIRKGDPQTDAEIADILFISPKTVSNHVGSILKKTGAGNRTEAARFAADHHLLSQGIRTDT